MSVIRTSQTATPVDLSHKSDKLPKKAQVEVNTEQTSGPNAWSITAELTIPISRAANETEALRQFREFMSQNFQQEGGLLHWHIIEPPKKVLDI
jgi:hypothetical protein